MTAANKFEALSAHDAMGAKCLPLPVPVCSRSLALCAPCPVYYRCAVDISGALNVVAVSLMKVANDIRYAERGGGSCGRRGSLT